MLAVGTDQSPSSVPTKEFPLADVALLLAMVASAALMIFALPAWSDQRWLIAGAALALASLVTCVLVTIAVYAAPQERETGGPARIWGLVSPIHRRMIVACCLLVGVNFVVFALYWSSGQPSTSDGRYWLSVHGTELPLTRADYMTAVSAACRLLGSLSLVGFLVSWSLLRARARLHD